MKKKQEKWTETKKKRRVHWFRTSNASARRNICKTGSQRMREKDKITEEKLKLTWLKQIKNRIEEMKLNYQDIETRTSNNL